MNNEEYFERYISHRVNLLITFKERYDLPTSQAHVEPELARDLFRCSKDMSMLMVRFFLVELGVRLPRRKANSADNMAEVKRWKSRNGIKPLSVAEVKSDKRFTSIFEVLKAANRAVAHLAETDVDHPIKVDSDISILFDAIDFTVEKVQEKMYHSSTGFVSEKVMALPDNDMKRKGLIGRTK